jgi:cytochrome P450
LIRDLEDPSVLFSETVLDDPRRLYRQLRREAPVWRLPDGMTFLVCDPELIGEIAARSDEFSSNLVSLIRRGADGGVAVQDMLPYRDPNHVLAVADPPDHTRQRKILQSALSASRVARLEPFVRELTGNCLQAMLRDGRGDLVSGLAEIVPAATICRLLGLPIEETGKLIPQVISVGALLDGLVDDAGMLQAAEAAVKLSHYAAEHLERLTGVREDQRSPVFDALIKARERGEISTTEIVGILIQLFTAGTETTQSLIATTAELLARDPEEQSRLRARSESIPDALERVLRDDGPFQFHYRWTPSATTLAGAPIAAGSRLLLMWAAANQPLDATQEVQSADPRDSPRGGAEAGRPIAHLAFGRGIHFCIGAALARMEARVVIETLLSSTRLFQLDPNDLPRRRPSIMLRRHACLPVLLERD